METPVFRHSRLAPLVVVLVCAGLSACGAGTAAALAGGGSSSSSNANPVASAFVAPRSATSPASISFVLTDQEGDAANVAIGFRSTPGASFQPITLAAGSAPLAGVPSSQTPYVVTWDFATDLGGNGYHAGIELQLVVTGGVSPAVLSGVRQGNDAPVVSLAAPAPPAVPPTPPAVAEYGGNTDVRFTVTDTAGDVVRIKVEYNDQASAGFPDNAWKLARPAATAGDAPTPPFALLAFETTPAGTPGTFRWDTIANLDEFDADVRVRFTPEDEFEAGAAVPTASFRIDNNAPPVAVLDEGAFVNGIKQRGNIPVSFQLFNQELSDTLKVLVQWRAVGQAFPTLPTARDDLVDLLENPAREAERRQKQIAVEAPLAFTGRVGTLAGLAPNQVRLPELASSAAGLLAHGIADRTLEILRPTQIPAPVVWTPNPLNGPVAALPSADGRTALVLDSRGAGWNLREIDLETGAIVRQVATGAGTPKAIGLDPSRTRVFVGSSTAVFRFDRALGTVLGSVPHSFVDGPRGLAPLGFDVVVATGDDRLARFDFTTGGVATVIDGLSEPWGVVVDPLDEGSVYLAERAADRVTTLDLGALQPRDLAAIVAPGDVSSLGTVPFPSPRALALEDHGTRLLVMTQFGPLASLRALDLRSPIDSDGAVDGRADPFVREVTQQLGDAMAAVGSGPDGLRVASLVGANRLALGGGVGQRRAILGDPQPVGQPAPYASNTQVVTLTAPLASSIGARWRIQAPLTPAGNPGGRLNALVWDTSEVPDPTMVQVRILAIDGDVGTGGIGTQFKAFQSTFDASPDTLTLAGSPVAVAAADLDGDGDIDLVSPDGNGSLLLSFQTAPGVFSPGASALITGFTPIAVAAADLDGDCDIDLVSANSDSSDLTLFFQSAPGVFTPGASALPALTPTAVAAADLDGDGDIDLVAANFNGPTLTLYFQTAPGVFAPGSTALLTGSFPISVAAADLDGDGDLDLCSANRDSHNLTLFFQTAPGVFTPGASALPTGAEPYSVAAADLDGDGDIDLVSANHGSSNLTMFFQTAPGAFTPGASALPAGSFPRSVAAADLDGDGDIDLVSANDTNGAVRMFFQTAPGAFTPGASVLPTGNFPVVVPADLDADGDIDLVLAVVGNSSLMLFFQTVPGAFAPGASAVPTGDFLQDIATGDLDGDGDIDIVTPNTRLLFVQTAPGVFTPREIAPQIRAPLGSMAAADLDGDGDLDLVAASGTFSLELFFQTAPGVFAPGASLLPTGPGPVAVVAADLDGDGDIDVVNANYDGDSLTVFFQTTPGVFTPGTTALPTGDFPGCIAAADLDGDRDLDLVAANSNSNSLTLFFQTAPGVFTPGASTLPTVQFPSWVAAADLDGDNDMDLVTADGSSHSLTLFLQTGPGAFSPRAIPLSANSSTRHVSAVDLDGDGDMDLVAAETGVNNLMLLFQTAPGVFTPGKTALPTGSAPVSVAAADFDGDGDLDLISANSPGNDLKLFVGGR